VQPVERARVSVSRTPCFFPHEGRHLYGALYLPDTSGTAPVGLVLCPPFADEAVHAHRVLVDFAGRLADAGIPALVFDYAGTGDSEGEFEGTSLDSYERDIAGAVACLRRRTRVARCGLLGLRLGATLAERAARLDPTLAALVLWAPILRPADYFRGFLRSRLLTEVTTLGRRTETVRTLEERLRAGEVVDVLGYGISGAMARSFLDDAPDVPSVEPTAPTLVVDVTPARRESGGASDEGRSGGLPPRRPLATRRVTDEAFWDRARVTGHGELFDVTLEWLLRTVAA
jgi:alpha/beta superfamily hydrolase